MVSVTEANLESILTIGKSDMAINIQAQNDFWWFVNERHRMYLKKQANQPKPWTEDPALRDWKYCNVFRNLDTQSKILISEYQQHLAPTQEIIFNTFVFRAFNWWITYKEIGGWFTKWDEETIKNVLAMLDMRYLNGAKLTSGAYMLRGREGIPKYESIVQTLTTIWENIESLTEEICETHDLENAYNAIMRQGFWGWGPFTAYQIVLDLSYSRVLSYPGDINNWCEFGPGAKKGLREIWPELPLRHDWMLQASKFLLIDQVKYREPHVPDMNLQDIEFCLCELSKYRRIKAGGKSKERYQGT